MEVANRIGRLVRNTNYLRGLLLLGALLVLGSFQVLAQEATIVGTVTDPSGAAVPNVNITITNTDTNVVSHFTTNDTGQFVAPHLQIGHYDVKADGAGFKTVDQKGLVLQNLDRRRVDFVLQVGSTQETVTVEAAPIAVQSDTNEQSTVITGTQISQLQTNGRTLNQLLALTPGASSGQSDFSAPTSMGGDANVSYNGNRQAHTLFMIDNAEAADRGGSGPIVQPSLSAISEFRVQTSNFSADYGLTSGAIVSSVIKSGSKQYHASAWWFGRNDAFDARNYFNPAVNANGKPNKVGELRYNLWGFNAGGPVDFWKKDNHKTFFFYNQEWRRLIQPGNVGLNVPFTQTYGGDMTTAANYEAANPGSLFGSVGPAAAGLIQPYQCSLSTAEQNKFTAAGLSMSACSGGVPTAAGATPFPGNVIPASLIDPNATALLTGGGPFGGIFPAPNSGRSYNAPVPAPTSVREEIVRVDHTFNDKWSLYSHYIQDKATQTDIPTRWDWANSPAGQDSFGNPSRVGVIHIVNTIRPNLLNEIAFNYEHNAINMVPTGLWDITKTKFQQNKIFGFKTNTLPNIFVSGKTGAVFNNNWNPWINSVDGYQIKDDMSLVKGAHQLKYGFSWFNFRKAQPLQTSPNGGFQFNGSFTGYDFADFLLGLSNNYSESALEDTRHWNSVSWGAYFQDDWRATRRLTLNLGLRWDGIPHTAEIHGLMANWESRLYNAAGAAAAFASGPCTAAGCVPLNGGVGFANANGSVLCSGVNIPNGSGCTGANPFLLQGPNPALNGLLMYANGIGLPNLTPGVTNGLVNNHWDTFGPRIGLAYDVTGKGQTIVRAGFGTFYERIQGNDMYQAAANENLYNANTSINNVSLLNPHIAIDNTNAVISTATLPVTVNGQTAFDPNNYKIPTEYQYSAGVQQQFGAQTVLSVAYVGNQGRFMSFTQNANIPPQSLLPNVVADKGATYNFLLPIQGFQTMQVYQTGENSHYNGVQASLRSHLSAGLTLQAGYTYSKAIDPSGTQTAGDGGDLDYVTNPYVGWKFDVGPSQLDRRNIFFANFIYDLPLFRHSTNGFEKGVLGGWQVSGIVNVVSGSPLNLQFNKPTICTYVKNCQVRPNLIGHISYPKSAAKNGSGNPTLLWFDPTQFGAVNMISGGGNSVPGWGTLGNNALTGPGRQNWNMALFKTFSAGERFQLELRAEGFNIWNHTEWRGVDNNVDTATSGQVNSAFDAREFQLGITLKF